MLNIRGLKLPMIGDKIVGGSVFFVDSGSSYADDENSGIDPDNKPLATITQAIALCENDRGDYIVVLPGHAEATTAEITINKSDVTIIGVGNGKNRPKITPTFASAGDTIAIDADDVAIDNLYFVAAGASQTANIDINAANATVKNCLFEQGASNAGNITITATGLDPVIIDNEVYVTANGPDHCIKAESATASDIHVIDNYFNGGSTTNAWDTGCILDTVGATEWRVKNNDFIYGAANIGFVQFTTSSATGMIVGNNVTGGTLAEMIDPGGCFCVKNNEADAVDETSRVFPTTAAS